MVHVLFIYGWNIYSISVYRYNIFYNNEVYFHFYNIVLYNNIGNIKVLVYTNTCKANYINKYLKTHIYFGTIINFKKI